MMQSNIRIESIEMRNFKNVKNGFLSLDNNRTSTTASIVGLYGQNGSGKTALIDALELLKHVLSGVSVPSFFCDFVNVNENFSSFRFIFQITNTESSAKYKVEYEFRIRKDESFFTVTTSSNFIPKNEKRIVVFDEVLSFTTIQEGKQARFSSIIDTRRIDPFGPKKKLDSVTSGSKETVTNLLVAKKLAATSALSFVFSHDLISILKTRCQDKVIPYILESLSDWGVTGLYVINTAHTSLIGLNMLCMAFHYKSSTKGVGGDIVVPLDESATIPRSFEPILSRVVKDMNIVLREIIPGLTIGVRNLGSDLSEIGEEVLRIQLVSHKNGKDIPLRYESEGIKKIISVLHLLIVLYSNASVTVAIDELDSGIFEYLLGEILKVISQKAKGQLIFTSHNLRPLETLDRGYIAFSTTDPEKRYIRLSKVKTNHNLRDFYYRDIILGDKNDHLYEMTNNSEIALAFSEAGESCGI